MSASMYSLAVAVLGANGLAQYPYCRFLAKGLEEGNTLGQKAGEEEGYQLGWDKGNEVW